MELNRGPYKTNAQRVNPPRHGKAGRLNCTGMTCGQSSA